MLDKKPERWITKNGKHIPIFEDSYTVPEEQKKYEEKIRSKTAETGAFFDKDGNILMESDGDADQVQFEGGAEFNHNVEQRIWNDEEVNFSHNHPDNTIFSPEDIGAFEELEYHSIRAICKNGKNYTLVREQPRSSHEYEIDLATGELKEKNPVKKIADKYYDEYSKVFDKRYDEIIKEYRADARKLELAKLDEEVATHMTKWLEKNAEKYGYRFTSEK